MNSRQRVVTALSHQEPDRVPFDCPFGFVAYEKVKRYIGFAEPAERTPTNPDLTIRPPIDFLQQMGIDLCYIGLGGGSNEPEFVYGMDQYVDEWGIGYAKTENNGVVSYEMRGHPLRDATLKDLADYPWPDPSDPARVAGLGEKCRHLYENTDLALVGRFNTPIFEQAFMLRGFEKFLMDIPTDPEFAGALLDKTTEIAIGLLEAGLRACGSYLQILRLAGDDMGHQSGTLLSPRTFRSLIKPRFERLYRSAKSGFHQHNPAGKVMAHTDGDVYALIPDYIEMGLDVLNPVQPYVTNMDHQRLKQEFGDRLSFHAGIDIQRLLPFGAPDEVRSEARRTMRNLGQGGGYILAPTHYLQADVPPENVLALRDAVLEDGVYPLR